MKRHKKIFAAVATVALVLGALTLASCSNSSSSDDSSGGGNGGNNGGSSSGNGGNAELSNLEGLWFDEQHETGFFFDGKNSYIAVYKNNQYFYIKETKDCLVVTGDKYTMKVKGDGEVYEYTGTFKLDGDKLTITDADADADEDEVFKKVSGIKPKPVSEDDIQ